MADEQKSLKSQNTRYILAILILNIFIISFTFHRLDITLLPFLWIMPLSIGLSATSATVIALAANHIIPRWIKEIIVFLRYKDVQPGCRAFSKRAGKDNRINVSSLENAVGKFPSAGNEQNALWYKLLKQHEDKAAIQYAHRNYLLFRDLASLSIILCILSLLLLFSKPSTSSASLTGWFALQYLIYMIAGRNSGNSLVDNVLAEASCQYNNYGEI